MNVGFPVAETPHPKKSFAFSLSRSIHPILPYVSLHQPEASRKIRAPTTSNLYAIHLLRTQEVSNAHQRGTHHSHGQSSRLAGKSLPRPRRPRREHPRFSVHPV